MYIFAWLSGTFYLGKFDRFRFGKNWLLTGQTCFRWSSIFFVNFVPQGQCDQMLKLKVAQIF